MGQPATAISNGVAAPVAVEVDAPRLAVPAATPRDEASSPYQPYRSVLLDPEGNVFRINFMMKGPSDVA